MCTTCSGGSTWSPSSWGSCVPGAADILTMWLTSTSWLMVSQCAIRRSAAKWVSMRTSPSPMTCSMSRRTWSVLEAPGTTPQVYQWYTAGILLVYQAYTAGIPLVCLPYLCSPRCAETYETLHKKTKKLFKVTARRPAMMHRDLLRKTVMDEFTRWRVRNCLYNGGIPVLYRQYL